VTTEPPVAAPGEIVSISVNAQDEDGDLLTFVYQPSGGTIGGSGPDVIWFAPQETGEYFVTIYVSDGLLESEQVEVKIIVTATGENLPPEITSATASPTTVVPGATSTIEVNAVDPEGNTLLYIYDAEAGKISGSGYRVTYRAPGEEGTYQITIIVSDGEKDSKPFVVSVVVFENDAPEITDVYANPTTVNTGEKSTITVKAFDPDGDKLSFNFIAERGTITGIGSEVSWTAPAFTGTFTIEISVSDPFGLSDGTTISLTAVSTPGPPEVINFDITPSVVGNDGTGTVIMSAEIVDPNGHGDIEIVYVDLTFIGGEEDQRLYDNGRHGDEIAGDGIYIFEYEVPYNTPKGTWEIIVNVEDREGYTATSNGLVIIENQVELDEPSGFDLGNPSNQIVLISIIIVTLILFFLFIKLNKNNQERY
jgi:hypothetical protein